MGVIDKGSIEDLWLWGLRAVKYMTQAEYNPDVALDNYDTCN